MASVVRRVLITGAGSGIGQGIAEALAKRGHEVLVTDVVRSAAEAVASSIVANGGKARAYALDVGQSESITATIASLDSPVDVLINNAGIQHVSRIEDFPPERFQQLLNVMLFGACMLTRACLPGMRQNGFGRIINIGSIHALVGSPYKSAYVAAKHGLIGAFLCAESFFVPSLSLCRGLAFFKCWFFSRLSLVLSFWYLHVRSRQGSPRSLPSRPATWT
jgi:3-hydroxybutyrate dehydrogenase